VDTTAAGDTFTGYFIAGLARGEAPERALDEGIRAAAICVSRLGAVPSIPLRSEIA
jgi:ribokinase